MSTRVLPFTEFCTRVGLTLTRGQRVLSRVVFDGVDPIDLPDDERALAAEVFGPVDRIPKSARSTIVLRCGRRGGKTLLSAAYCVYLMCTASLARVGKGDKAAVVVIAPDKLAAQQAVSQALAIVEGDTFLKRMLVQQREDGFTLRRPDDRLVRFIVRAKSGRGATVRGFSLIALIIDESEFIPADPSRVVRDTDIIAAAQPALLGPLLLCSTPWPAESATSTYFDGNFGAPSSALCARAPTLLLRDNAPEWVAKVEAERQRDARNALREYDCICTDGDGLFFDASTIDAAVCTTPIVSYCQRSTAGMDLAFRSDSSALVVTERQGDRLLVVHHVEKRPEPGAPLVPSTVIGEFADTARSYGAREIVTDHHYIETAREHAIKAGLQIVPTPSGTTGKEKSYAYVRDLLREGRLVIPNDKRLIQQLKSVMVRAQPGGGLSIILPRTGAGHADLVSALVAAVYYDRRHGPMTAPTLAPHMPLRGPRPFAGLAGR